MKNIRKEKSKTMTEASNKDIFKKFNLNFKEN